MFNPDSCLTCICNIWRVKRPRATFWPTPKAKPQWPDRQGACYTHHLVPCRVRRQKKGIKPQSFPMQVFSKSTLASAARKRCVRGNQRFGCVSAALPWFSSPALCSTPRGDVMRPQPPPTTSPVVLVFIPLYLHSPSPPSPSFLIFINLSSSSDSLLYTHHHHQLHSHLNTHHLHPYPHPHFLILISILNLIVILIFFQTYYYWY